MDKNRMMGLLSEAASEIEGLRHRNQILSAQVEVVRIFGRCAGAESGGNGAMTPDVVYALRATINEIGHSMMSKERSVGTESAAQDPS